MSELFIFAGPNGSGKSTLISQFIQKYDMRDFEYINPDIYAHLFFNNIEDEVKKYYAAFDFAEYKRAKALEENRDIIIETVGSTLNKFDFYKDCRDKNYKITVVYIATKSPEINIARVAIRKTQGGHEVGEDKITSRYYKSLELMFDLTLFADVLYIFDNSDKLRLCFYKDGQNTYLADDIPKWIEQYFFKPLKEFENG